MTTTVVSGGNVTLAPIPFNKDLSRQDWNAGSQKGMKRPRQIEKPASAFLIAFALTTSS